MKKVFLKASLLLATTLIIGCAAKLPAEKGPEVIELECKAASHQGCRYKGRVYPWNAWVEMKGYDSKEFEVKEVIRSGPAAVVQVIAR